MTMTIWRIPTTTGRILSRGLGPFLASIVVLLGLAFSDIVFLYIVEVKTIFHYSQVQAELQLSVHAVGLYCLLPFTALHSRIGYYGSSAVCFVVACGGLLLMAFACWNPNTFEHYPIAIFIAQFLIANGRSFSNFLVIISSVETLPENQVEKAMLCLSVVPFLGNLLASILYRQYFADSHNLSGYFFLCAIVFVTTFAGHVITYGVAKHCGSAEDDSYLEGGSDDNLKRVSKDNNEMDNAANGEKLALMSADSRVVKTDVDSENTKGAVCAMLRNVKFHLLFWSAAVTLTTSTVMYLNLNLMLQSKRLDFGFALLGTLFGTVAVSRLVFGIIGMYMKSAAKKICIQLVNTLCNVMCFVVILICGEDTVLLFVSVIFLSLRIGMSVSNYVSLSKYLFGMRESLFFQSILVTCRAIMTPIVNLVVGVIYEKMSKSQNAQGNICYGRLCYQWVFVLLLSLSAFAPVLLLLLLYLVKR